MLPGYSRRSITRQHRLTVGGGASPKVGVGGGGGGMQFTPIGNIGGGPMPAPVGKSLADEIMQYKNGAIGKPSRPRSRTRSKALFRAAGIPEASRPLPRREQLGLGLVGIRILPLPNRAARRKVIRLLPSGGAVPESLQAANPPRSSRRKTR